MTVHIPSPLRSYTARKDAVDAPGGTLGEVLSALDQRYPGFRFRIVTEQDTVRPHIRIFVNAEQTQDLAAALRPNDQVYIICALSGG